MDCVNDDLIVRDIQLSKFNWCTLIIAIVVVRPQYHNNNKAMIESTILLWFIWYYWKFESLYLLNCHSRSHLNWDFNQSFLSENYF